MTDIFKQKKISVTPFRKDVLEIFNKYENAIPLSTIEKELKNFNRITLYRTIKLFIEKGVIHEITISGESSNYATCIAECSHIEHKHQHIHFKCKKCKLIFCVEIKEFPIINLPKHKIEQLEIQATGLCDICNIN